MSQLRMGKFNLKPETFEKPQGVGLLFLLASLKKTEKKPHPSRAFPDNPLYTYQFVVFFIYTNTVYTQLMYEIWFSIMLL